MNELATLNDIELDKAISELEERKRFMATKQGYRFICAKMRECIGWLKSIGYKFEGEEKALTELWAQNLSEEFIRLGESGVKKAVMNFAVNNERDYKPFPQLSWIKDECRKIGGDPRAEKGRREQARREQAIEQEGEREFNEWKNSHPEEAKRIAERAKKAFMGGDSKVIIERQSE